MVACTLCGDRLFSHKHPAAAATSGGGKRGAKGRGAFPLLGVALEGVRRYGHHISVDYFADLNAVLASLARRASLALPLRLQALATGVHISRYLEQGVSICPMQCWRQTPA